MNVSLLFLRPNNISVHKKKMAQHQTRLRVRKIRSVCHSFSTSDVEIPHRPTKEGNVHLPSCATGFGRMETFKFCKMQCNLFPVTNPYDILSVGIHIIRNVTFLMWSTARIQWSSKRLESISNSRRQKGDMKQVPCSGTTTLEPSVKLLSSGAFCWVHVNWYTFLCVRKKL